jgi:hypothetical protein
MSNNLVLDLVLAIRGDVTEVRADLRGLKYRITAVVEAVNNLAAVKARASGDLLLRIDRIDGRLERIEQRLGRA